MRAKFFWFGLMTLPVAAFGHHSVSGIFDANVVIELEGEVTEVLWRNPHIHFEVRGRDADGQMVDWDVESTSLSNLRRWDIAPEFISVGDQVRLAVNPSKRGTNQVYARNVLPPNGEEVLLGQNVAPRFSSGTVNTAATQVAEADGSRPDLGIFRVWSTSDAPMLFPQNVNSSFDMNTYPLTASARASVASFDHVTDSPTLNCEAKGMPTIMEQPYPLEFARAGDNIILRMEEYDTVRTIYMDPSALPGNLPPSRLGVSLGRWENDNTLVVTTSGADWGHFDVVGVPQSPDATHAERLTLADDGSRLDYSITITDPANFIEPVTLQKYWIWVPGQVVSPYECLTSD